MPQVRRKNLIKGVGLGFYDEQDCVKDSCKMFC